MPSKTKLKAHAEVAFPVFFCMFTFLFFALTIILVPTHLYHLIGGLIALTSFVLWITALLQYNSIMSRAPANHLIMEGVYAKVRHPMYYFSVTALLGINVFLWSFLMTPVVLVVGFIQLSRARKEDKTLLKQHGRKYRGYIRRTWA